MNQILKVVKSEPLKKKNGYFKIIFDNNIEIEVIEETFIKYRLVKGKEIESNLLDEINDNAILMNAYTDALKYIGSNLQCSYKVRQKLIKKEYSNDNINEVISMLEKANIINDELYAKEFVQYYIRNSHGRLYIEAKAKEIKLDINKALLEIDMDEYNSYMKKIIVRQIKMYKNCHCS